MRSVTVLIGLVVAGAIVLGLALSDADVLNPKTSDAMARRMNAETDAYISQMTYEQKRQELELRVLEERSAIEAQALVAQRAKELELMERDAQLKSRLLELAVLLSFGIVAVIGGAAAFYLLCAGFALLRQQKQPATEVAREGRRVISFPGLLQRARVLANNPAAALALLVLGVAVLTVSVASL